MRFRRKQRIYGCKHQKGCFGERDYINCLLVGPHLASNFDAILEDIEGYDIKCAIISKECYAKLNGDMAVDQILELFGNK